MENKPITNTKQYSGKYKRSQILFTVILGGSLDQDGSG